VCSFIWCLLIRNASKWYPFCLRLLLQYYDFNFISLVLFTNEELFTRDRNVNSNTSICGQKWTVELVHNISNTSASIFFLFIGTKYMYFTTSQGNRLESHLLVLLEVDPTNFMFLHSRVLIHLTLTAHHILNRNIYPHFWLGRDGPTTWRPLLLT